MKLYQVDAFTSEIFRGNPAGVCVLPEQARGDDSLLQNIAMEMNLSETAFLYKQGDEYTLRWFTPLAEVEFCGHATLSSAHILWETGIESRDSEIIFNSKAGKLSARKLADAIELTFPALEVAEAEPDAGIARAFGIEPLFVGKDRHRYLIEVGSCNELLSLKPDFTALKKFGVTGFTLTCKSDDGKHDFCSRFFAPAVGIDEDPVTGSAHSYLTPYWARKLNKKKLLAYQASKRTGEIECELTDDNRVLLRGKAVTVFEIDMKIIVPS